MLPGSAAVLLFPILSLIAATEEGKKDSAKEEMKKLEGTWVITSAEVDGKLRTDSASLRFNRQRIA
jgi:hypothetical protein